MAQASLHSADPPDQVKDDGMKENEGQEESLKGRERGEPSSEMDIDLQKPGSHGSHDDSGGGGGGTEINTSKGEHQEEDGRLERPASSHNVEPEPLQPESSSLDIQEPDKAVLFSDRDLPPQPHPNINNINNNINNNSSNSSHISNNREIEQESIKQTLHDIISEIDREMEAEEVSSMTLLEHQQTILSNSSHF